MNGPAIRNRLRLPHPVNTSLRICVICPPDSPIAASAIKAGASIVGDDAIIDAVKDSRIEFDRCLCHVDSVQKINKAGLGKVLGPKGLMPSAKTGTVVKDVAASVRELVGGSEYRERQGVIRMAVGQLGFTPEEMQRNIKVFMDGLKKDISQMSDRISKEIHEVVRILVTSLVLEHAEADVHQGPKFHQCARIQFERGIQESDISTDPRFVGAVI